MRRLQVIILWLICTGAIAQAAPRNVLLIIADDLRPELGCYGDSPARTPNIDRFARDGVVFERAFCPQALCAPSRAALFTGARPDTTRVWDVWTHFRRAMPEVVTLPQRLQRHGWFAQAVGKVYHTNLDDPPSWSVPHVMPVDPLYGSPETKALLAEKRRRAEAEGLTGVPFARAIRGGPPAEAPDVADGVLVDGMIADLALKALRENRERAQPFFLAVGFTKPHLPFVAPKKYWDLYDRRTLSLAPRREPPEGAPNFALGDSGELYGYHEVPRAGAMSDDYQHWLRHGYLASISYMDAQVGRVLEELERLGLAEDTVVIFWGDNGYKLGDYAAWTKTTNVFLDTRVPLIVRAPGVAPAGKRAGGMVEVADIYPTLLELFDLALPDGLEGTSFLPLLKSPRAHWKEAVFTQSPQNAAGQAVMGYSVVTEGYRFTQWFERDAAKKVIATELYELGDAFSETVNVANQGAHAKTRREMEQLLSAGWKGAPPPR